MPVSVGDIVEGKVTAITKFGAFVMLPERQSGMVHISEITNTYVKEVRDYLTENQEVKVKVISIDENGKIGLSIKKAEPPQPKPQRSSPPPITPDTVDFNKNRAPKPTGSAFEDMMARFKMDSDEKMSDLKRTMEAKRGGFSRRGGGNQKY